MAKPPHPSVRRSRPEVLLVEDNPADARLFEIQTRTVDPGLRLSRAPEGSAALAMLAHQNFDLVVLDLNLPGLSGLEVLRSIRQSPQTCHLPVIVFSTSNAPSDIEEAYRLGASGYLVKPHDLDDYARACKYFLAFWLNRVVLPRPAAVA